MLKDAILLAQPLKAAISNCCIRLLFAFKAAKRCYCLSEPINILPTWIPAFRCSCDMTRLKISNALL